MDVEPAKASAIAFWSALLKASMNVCTAPIGITLSLHDVLVAGNLLFDFRA
jgi:hypothetical protein